MYDYVNISNEELKNIKCKSCNDYYTPINTLGSFYMGKEEFTMYELFGEITTNSDYDASIAQLLYLISKTKPVVAYISYNDILLWVNPDLTHFEIPENIKYLYTKCFGHSSIKILSIPENVNMIGHLAFSGSELKIITVEGEIELLYETAFEENNHLNSVIFNKGVKCIEEVSIFETCFPASEYLLFAQDSKLKHYTEDFNEKYCAYIKYKDFSSISGKNVVVLLDQIKEYITATVFHHNVTNLSVKVINPVQFEFKFDIQCQFYTGTAYLNVYPEDVKYFVTKTFNYPYIDGNDIVINDLDNLKAKLDTQIHILNARLPIFPQKYMTEFKHIQRNTNYQPQDVIEDEGGN